MRHFGKVFIFPLSGPDVPDLLANQCVCDCLSSARAARDFFKDFGIRAPETPKFSLGCRDMKACPSDRGHFLSPGGAPGGPDFLTYGFLNGGSGLYEAVNLVYVYALMHGHTHPTSIYAWACGLVLQ